MLLGTADEGAAVDLVRGGGSDDAPGPAAGCRVNRGPVALVTGVALISGTPAGWNVTSGRLPARVPGQVMYPQPVHGAGRVVRKVARRAGIGKTVTPHTLRHAFITAALDAGVPLRDVQEAASHADPRTTMRYDRARGSLDRHATYIVAAYVAGAAR